MVSTLLLRVGCLSRPLALRQHALQFYRPLSNSHVAQRNTHDEPSTSDVERIQQTTTSKTTLKEERIVHPSISHLDRPSQSEGMVHADRLPAHEDPLKKEDKANSGTEEFSRSLWRVEQGKREGEGRTKEWKEKMVLEEWEELDAQHPITSGLPHLAKPSLSEEIVHADRFPEDPLAEIKKTRKKSAGSKPGVSKSSIPVQPEDEVLSRKS